MNWICEPPTKISGSNDLYVPPMTFMPRELHLIGFALIFLDHIKNLLISATSFLIFFNLGDISVRSSANARLDVLLELKDGLYPSFFCAHVMVPFFLHALCARRKTCSASVHTRSSYFGLFHTRSSDQPRLQIKRWRLVDFAPFNSFIKALVCSTHPGVFLRKLFCIDCLYTYIAIVDHIFQHLICQKCHL